MERRKCKRFGVFGMVLSCRIEKGWLFKRSEEIVEAPVFDISYGGARFLCDSRIKSGAELNLDISVPGEEPLLFKGKVVRISSPAGQSYRYEIGVQFHPYGDKKGCNPPDNLDRLKALAHKANPPMPQLATDQI